MSQANHLPGSTAQWLAHAESDLRLAQLGAGQEDVLRAQICFHAQQAAEKSLKAVLLGSGTEFPLTHDLEQLLQLCEHGGIDVPAEIQQVGRLTPYAVETRYPGHSGEISRSEVKEALDLAQGTVSWAHGVLDG